MSNAAIFTITANLQLVYVTDVNRSKEFYKFIFKKDPVFVTPRYVAFSSSGEALFAIWSGGDAPEADIPRFSEIGIMLPTGKDVDNLFVEWKEQNEFEINVIKEPYSDVFGRTFLIKDPDGHIIRVCPLD